MDCVYMWRNEDCYRWAVGEAQKAHLQIADIELQNFSHYTGEELMSFDPDDFMQVTEKYHIFFYERLKDLLQEQGLGISKQSPEYVLETLSNDSYSVVAFPSDVKLADDDNDNSISNLTQNMYEILQPLETFEADITDFANSLQSSLLPPLSSSSTSSSSTSWQNEPSNTYYSLTPLDSTPLLPSISPSSYHSSSTPPLHPSSSPYNPDCSSSSSSSFFPHFPSPPASPSQWPYLDDSVERDMSYSPYTLPGEEYTAIIPPTETLPAASREIPDKNVRPARKISPTHQRETRHLKRNSSPTNSNPSLPKPLQSLQTRTRSRFRGPSNWEFLMRLLVDEEYNPSLVSWVNRSEGTFKLNQPAEIAKLFGGRSRNKNGNSNLTYDNFARGLRYHYGTGALEPVPEHQLMYKCGSRAIEFLHQLTAPTQL